MTASKLCMTWPICMPTKLIYNHSFDFNCKNKWNARDIVRAPVRPFFLFAGYFASFFFSECLCVSTMLWTSIWIWICVKTSKSWWYAIHHRHSNVYFIKVNQRTNSLLRFISWISMIIDGNHIIFIRNQLNSTLYTLHSPLPTQWLKCRVGKYIKKANHKNIS